MSSINPLLSISSLSSSSSTETCQAMSDVSLGEKKKKKKKPFEPIKQTNINHGFHVVCKLLYNSQHDSPVGECSSSRQRRYRAACFLKQENDERIHFISFFLSGGDVVIPVKFT